MEDYTTPITETSFEAPTIEPIHNDILDGVPTVQDMTAEATSEFGWKQGLVLGGLAIGGACTLYTGYKVFIDKNGLVRGKLVPWIKDKFAKNQTVQQEPVQNDQQEEFIPDEAYVDEA